MISYHCGSNEILVVPLKSRKDSNQLLVYNKIMTQLKQQNQLVELQISDNEASVEYKTTMRDIWKVDYQLVPPNLHRCNSTERAICTFKANCLSILAGIAEDFPKNLWDLLIPEMEMTLNI